MTVRGESQAPGGLPTEGASALDGVSEQAWIEVIQKMDEVYNDLIQYEVALEEKNAALENSHQFIRSVLASMSDILVVCDRDGRIEDVNDSLVRLSGRSADSLRGAPVREVLGDDAFLTRTSQGEIHDREVPLTTAAGVTLALSINCTPRHAANGRFLGMVITGRPVGELKRAYKALQQAHEDLKRTQQQLLQAEKLASLGRLVAGVAHELNNPISFVLGNVLALKRYAERLGCYLAEIHTQPVAQADPALAARRGELRIDRILADLPPLIEGMIEGAERTREIVDGLKRFAARDQQDLEPFNLVEVITRAARWVAKASGNNALDVVTDLPQELPVRGSSGQLQQVVMNIVQNAADATAGIAQPRLQVSGRIQDGWVIVEFRDNGPGISPEAFDHLFEPFFTTKPVGRGTGLGLSISYGIVERHGGTLLASSHADGGALFHLRLPVALAGRG